MLQSSKSKIANVKHTIVVLQHLTVVGFLRSVVLQHLTVVDFLRSPASDGHIVTIHNKMFKNSFISQSVFRNCYNCLMNQLISFFCVLKLVICLLFFFYYSMIQTCSVFLSQFRLLGPKLILSPDIGYHELALSNAHNN